MSRRKLPQDERRYAELAAFVAEGPNGTSRHARVANQVEEEEFDGLLEGASERGVAQSVPTPEALPGAIGAEEVRHAVRGRHSLGAGAHRGVSPKRQVRLPVELDRALTERAERERTSASEVMRAALAQYLRAS